MKIVASKSCEPLAHIASKFIHSRSVDIQDAVSDMTLHIGEASDPQYRTPRSAQDCLFVGDSAHIGTLIASAQVKQRYEMDRNSVRLFPKYNHGKWDMVAREVPNGTMDALPDLINGQMIAPWSTSFFTDIFERPLIYSHAQDMVATQSCTNPWCEVMNLYMADYGGSAIAPNSAGSPDGNMTKDVTVTSGMMSAMVVNMFVTYSFTLEEQEAANSGSGNPFGSQMMAKKVQYANYVLQLLTDYLTYYGNADTSTEGLFQATTVTSYGGKSLKAILDDTTDEAKGSTVYAALAKIFNEFFDASYNKFQNLKVAMSTYAFNRLQSTPYSRVYSADSAMSVFAKNYGGGENTKTGTSPRITFYADPLLDANTEFNPTGNDYLVITCPRVATGTEGKEQDVILQGMPLKEFVYPVIPGMVNTQHRMLRRYAGVFCPMEGSVAIFSGFGRKAGE